MRKRYIQDPVTLELVPAEDYERAEPLSPMVMPDIQPYRSMITGEMITSRSTHRSHLKQHGCIEVGNEWKPSQQKQDPHRGLKRTIAEIVNSRS